MREGGRQLYCRAAAEMSQRQGPPRTDVSSCCLKLVAWLTCREIPNEWQQVWDGRDELHHEQRDETTRLERRKQVVQEYREHRSKVKVAAVIGAANGGGRGAGGRGGGRGRRAGPAAPKLPATIEHSTAKLFAPPGA